MAAPLIPLLLLATAAVVAVKLGSKNADTTKKTTAGTSKFYKPISPDVPPGNVFFGISGTTPPVDRLGLIPGQRVTAVLELAQSANPLANPHVLGEFEIVTVAPAPAGGGTPTYGLRYVRLLNVDSNFKTTTPTPDPSVAFIVTPLEIAQVGAVQAQAA